MNETTTKTIVLEKYNIQLEPDEQVIEIVENEKRDGLVLFHNNWVKIATVTGIILLSAIWFWVSLIIFGLITLSVLAKTFIINKGKPIGSKGITVFTNQRIIPPSRKSVNWKEVYDIDVEGLDDDGYLVFDLTHKKIVYNPKGTILWNTQERSDYILLGGIYDTQDLLQRIELPWKKNGPIFQLENIKQKLLDQYSLKQTKEQPPYETLLGTYEDFSLTYSHKNRFPVTNFKAGIKLKEPVLAYLSITMTDGRSQLKDALGIRDIQVGAWGLDELLYIKGSHPKLIKKLFTSSMIIAQFQFLLKHATITLSFGKPLKKLSFNPLKSKLEDNETVLDFPLATDQSEESAKHLGYKHLSVELQTKNKDLTNVNLIDQLSKICIDIALHFANGLKSIEDE